MNGTTGESMSLSLEERKLLAEEWCRKAKGKWVIAGNSIFTQFLLKKTQNYAKKQSNKHMHIVAIP